MASLTDMLRAKRFEPGVYRMFSRGAGTLGYLRVTEIWQNRVTPSDGWPHDLALTEGYESMEAFMDTLRRLRLDPNKPYWLHVIEPCEVPHA